MVNPTEDIKSIADLEGMVEEAEKVVLPFAFVKNVSENFGALVNSSKILARLKRQQNPQDGFVSIGQHESADKSTGRGLLTLKVSTTNPDIILQELSTSQDTEPITRRYRKTYMNNTTLAQATMGDGERLSNLNQIAGTAPGETMSAVFAEIDSHDLPETGSPTLEERLLTEPVLANIIKPNAVYNKLKTALNLPENRVV